MTLLGIGGIPGVASAEPRHDGHARRGVGQHRDQEADLLLAFGMRFDDRVTGNLKTYAPNAKKIHIDIDPAEIGKNVKVERRALSATCGRCWKRCCPAWSRGIVANGWITSRDLKGDSAVRDIQNLPDDGHLYAAHVIHDIWRTTQGRRDCRDRCRPASDVGGAACTTTTSRDR